MYGKKNGLRSNRSTSSATEAGLRNCENELRTHYVVVRGTVA